MIKHKHLAGRTIRNSNFRSSDSSLWHWPRCPIGIIPLYIPRWIDSLFKLTCLFDLWQCQSVFEEQPFNRHRTVRRIGYCSRSGRGGSLPLIPLLSFALMRFPYERASIFGISLEDPMLWPTKRPLRICAIKTIVDISLQLCCLLVFGLLPPVAALAVVANIVVIAVFQTIMVCRYMYFH